MEIDLGYLNRRFQPFVLVLAMAACFVVLFVYLICRKDKEEGPIRDTGGSLSPPYARIVNSTREPLSSQITLEEHYVQNEKKFFAAFFTYNFLNQNAIIIVMTAAYDVAHQF